MVTATGAAKSSSLMLANSASWWTVSAVSSPQRMFKKIADTYHRWRSKPETRAKNGWTDYVTSRVSANPPG